MDRKILVVLDGSREAEAILPCVVRLAREVEAKVILLSVAVPPDTEDSGVSMTSYGPVGMPKTERLEARLERYLRAVAMYLEIRGVKAQPVVVVGSPFKEIPAQARAHACNLIATACQGDSTLGRGMLVHSVADDIPGACGAAALAVSPEHMGNCKEMGTEMVLGRKV